MQHNNMNNAPPTWAKSKQDKEKAPPHKQRQNAIKVMKRINNPARNATTFIQRPALTGQESSGNQCTCSPSKHLPCRKCYYFRSTPRPYRPRISNLKIRVPPITHTVLFPVKTLAISPKKNVGERKGVLACPATHQQRQFDCQRKC